jgi:hypothetical protein
MHMTFIVSNAGYNAMFAMLCYHPTFPPIHLFTYPPVHLSTYPPIHLFTYSPIYLFAYLPIRLFTYSPIYLFAYPPFHHRRPGGGGGHPRRPQRAVLEVPAVHGALQAAAPGGL